MSEIEQMSQTEKDLLVRHIDTYANAAQQIHQAQSEFRSIILHLEFISSNLKYIRSLSEARDDFLYRQEVVQRKFERGTGLLADAVAMAFETPGFLARFESVANEHWLQWGSLTAENWDLKFLPDIDRTGLHVAFVFYSSSFSVNDEIRAVGSTLISSWRQFGEILSKADGVISVIVLRGGRERALRLQRRE